MIIIRSSLRSKALGLAAIFQRVDILPPTYTAMLGLETKVQDWQVGRKRRPRTLHL